MKDRILRTLPKMNLLVVEVGEAPRLVPHGRRHPRNIPDKHCVKVFGHFQVVAGAQGLEIRQVKPSKSSPRDLTSQEPRSQTDVLTEQKTQVHSSCSRMEESAASHWSQTETGHSRTSALSAGSQVTSHVSFSSLLSAGKDLQN